MTTSLTSILKELESLGTETNRKTFHRHGASDPLFGVSFANLEKLRKRIKIDHNLAKQLWDSGNYDARILAMMIADPAALSDRDAAGWVRQLDCNPVTDQLAGLIAKSGHGQKTMEKWIKSKEPWTACAGWGVLSRLASGGPDLPDDYFKEYLKTIETAIQKSPNRVRHSMNGALISIGCRNEPLKTTALAVAAVIGEVKVDHGDTACKTPDAAAYIEKRYAKKK